MSAKVEKTGSCSFCGQTKIIQVPEEWEQGQINEAVTCECECEQAQAYAKAKERKDKAKKRVNELFGGGAEKPVAEDAVNLLIATVDAIEDKHMKGITVDVGHGVKAKVSKMAKESIKVERSENKKTTYEESDDLEQLKEWVKRIEEFLENEMLLHINPKSTILYAGNGIDFCGYIHYADHKKVRKSSIRKLKQDVKAYELGELPPEEFNRKYESRKGHLGHADTYHIAKAVEYELLFYEWERLEATA